MKDIAQRVGFSDSAHPWVPDLGDGTYRNPILHADYSDPDAIPVGEDFYLTASSFNCTPGLPILHSRDLVNWTIINHAVRNVPHQRYDEAQHGCGVWAPAIRHHAGKFWIVFPMPDEGTYWRTNVPPDLSNRSVETGSNKRLDQSTMRKAVYAAPPEPTKTSSPS